MFELKHFAHKIWSVKLLKRSLFLNGMNLYIKLKTSMVEDVFLVLCSDDPQVSYSL